MKISYIRLILLFTFSQIFTFYLDFLNNGAWFTYSEALAWGAGFMGFIGAGISILLDLEKQG